MKATMPPEACALATACRATVVLPEASGPYTSTTRPRGRPPTPRAMSRAIEPVGMTFMATSGLSPRRMTEPLPNCLSIWARAMSSALSRSSVAMVHTFGSRGSGSEPTLGRGTDSFGAGGRPVESRPACGRNCRANACSIARATRHLFRPASALLGRNLVLLADGQPDLAHRQPGLDRVDRTPPTERGEDMIPGHALGAHGPELTVETGPELLQAHGSTLTRARVGAR